MVELTDADLLLRLTNFEDNFVERKTIADSRDWLKTAVAFANSVPVGYPAVLFVGVKDDGTVQPGTTNLEKLQRSVSEQINKAYPPIYHLHRVLQDGAGNQFLAVIIPGSEQRPHFSGQAYVRSGSDSIAASEPQFQALVAQRQSKAYEILKWKGMVVSAEAVRKVSWGVTRSSYEPGLLIVDCNSHYVTLEQPTDSQPYIVSHPLERIVISYDNQRNRINLEIHEV